MPLVTVDYSGGMIITDWYTDSNTTNDSLKFTIRFLSNQIRADSLKIIIHKKTCKSQENCIITKITSNRLEDAIRSDIIKKAAQLKMKEKLRNLLKKPMNSFILKTLAKQQGLVMQKADTLNFVRIL